MAVVNVSLDSLAVGTVPSVTDSISVNKGGKVTFNITWPAGTNNGTCKLVFNSTSQDPFNDEMGGTTSFDFNRANANAPATNTLTVEADATVGTDTYCLTLTIDGNDYSKDPMMDIDP